MTQKITLIELVMRLHEVRGLPPLSAMRGSLWQSELPDGWYFAVNGSKKKKFVTPPGGMRVKVRPFHVTLWYNGNLAGDESIDGRGFIAAGTQANFQSLYQAFQKAIHIAESLRTPIDPIRIQRRDA